MCRLWSWFLLSLFLCWVLWATATPLDPSTSPSDADASLVASPYPTLTQMATSEFTVDRDGLWTNTEVPLSDASMRAILEATLASPTDEEAVASTPVYTAAAADEMETSAVDEHENESENVVHVVEDGIDRETEDETPIALDDASSSESETSATDLDLDLEDEIDIATGHHGRMILTPRSSRLEMKPLINRLTRIISELIQRSPLDRITLKLEIEPLIPSARHVIPRARARVGTRVRPSLPRLELEPLPGSRTRALRPVSIRLVPSRSEIRTRAMLARCRMLLRQALKKLKKMKLRRTLRRRLLAPHRKPRMTRLARWLRRLGVGLGVGRVRGVTVLHGNNFTKTDGSTRRISRGNIEVDAEQNSTARVFAPSIALRSHGGSMLVVNRGVIVIVNRSANNTVSVASQPRAPSPHLGMYRRFMTPSSHVELAAAVNTAPDPPIAIEPALNAVKKTTATYASTPDEK